MSLDSTSATALPALVRRLLEEHFAGDVNLPVLPDTAMQVMALCRSEKCDAQLLSDRIRRDQALAGHVLRVANSSAYAPKEPIVSLRQAVSRLGISTVQEIAIAVSLNGRVFNAPGWQVRIRDLWMHSAAAAVYAKEVARFLRFNVESAFMCGLLHDIGRPVVLQALLDIAKRRTDLPVPQKIAEAAMDEFHERVGAMVIRRWKLASWLIETTANHHRYPAESLNIEHIDDLRVTVLADALSHWALDEEATKDDFPTEHPVLQDLDIYADDLVELLDMRKRVLEVAESFI